MGRRIASTFLAVAVALALLLVGGCKDSQLSQKEVDEIKQGPPKTMPAEAANAMKNMGSKGPSPGTPPRPAGQPGPGSPLSR